MYIFIMYMIKKNMFEECEVKTRKYSHWIITLFMFD
jgi:hypothetical protein